MRSVTLLCACVVVDGVLTRYQYPWALVKLAKNTARDSERVSRYCVAWRRHSAEL